MGGKQTIRSSLSCYGAGLRSCADGSSTGVATGGRQSENSPGVRKSVPVLSCPLHNAVHFQNDSGLSYAIVSYLALPPMSHPLFYLPGHFTTLTYCFPQSCPNLPTPLPQKNTW